MLEKKIPKTLKSIRDSFFRIVCFVCREGMSNYDPAKDPRLGSTEKLRALCTRHGKERGITNLDYNGDGTYNCKIDCQCKAAGKGSKGEGTDYGKDKAKSKQTRTPHGKPSGPHSDRPQKGGPPRQRLPKQKENQARKQP